MKTDKVLKAREFVRKIGMNLNTFCNFFFDDEAAVGHMGYYTSWKFIKKGDNSVKRYTNIDCLILKLLGKEPEETDGNKSKKRLYTVKNHKWSN